MDGHTRICANPGYLNSFNSHLDNFASLRDGQIALFNFFTMLNKPGQNNLVHLSFQGYYLELFLPDTTRLITLMFTSTSIVYIFLETQRRDEGETFCLLRHSHGSRIFFVHITTSSAVPAGRYCVISLRLAGRSKSSLSNTYALLTFY